MSFGYDVTGFNPRSREGNDVNANGDPDAYKIVSIHVPAKGTTSFREQLITLSFEFQSTFPRRERQYQRIKSSSGTGVSIHVPAKGTTVSAHQKQFGHRRFNPRSREGNDEMAIEALEKQIPFQSTFPRRERLNTFRWSRSSQPVSIHVPAKGTTLKFAISAHFIFKFQSTFPRRERRTSDSINDLSWFVSIHVPAKGTTHIIYCI